MDHVDNPFSSGAGTPPPAFVGREDLIETYYTAHLWRGLSASGGLQYIDHPGYNRDRGPVLVEMLRLHVEF